MWYEEKVGEVGWEKEQPRLVIFCILPPKMTDSKKKKERKEIGILMKATETISRDNYNIIRTGLVIQVR